MSDSENSEPRCNCDLLAKLRMSLTAENKWRLFYNCCHREGYQCRYFAWCDQLLPTKENHLKELEFMRQKCAQLHQEIGNLQRELIEVQEERTSIHDELNDLKKNLEPLNGSDACPHLMNCIFQMIQTMRWSYTL